MDNISLKHLLILGITGLLLFSFPLQTITAQCDSTALDLPHNGIDEDCDLLDGLSLHMPSYIYMVEGKEFDFYYRNVFLSDHPTHYIFEIQTTLPGSDEGDYWHYMPTANAVGEHPFTFIVKDATGKIYASRSSTVRLAAAQTPGNAPKSFIQMGHSLVDQGVMVYYLRQHTEEVGNPPISFHGTNTSYVDGMTKHQGKGGTSWRFYNEDFTSPLLNNGQLDIRSYFDAVVCPTCNPDFLVIQLDVNDYCFTGFVSGKTFEETSDYIDADFETNIRPIIEALQSNAPDMKIAVCLTPPANGRPGVFFNHFGSNEGLGNTRRWKNIVNEIYRKYTQFFGGREKEGIYLLPVHFGVDDFNHFDDIDPIHPYPSNGDITKPNGYRSAARDMYAWMKNLMNDEAQGACRINAQTQNIRCDNNGTPNNSNDDLFSFDIKAENTFGGASWKGSVNGQNYSGDYNTFIELGPFSTENPILLSLEDGANSACTSLFTVSSESCSNGQVAQTDIELSISTDTPLPLPFTDFKVEYKLENKSNVPAQNVWVKLPPAPQVSFPNGDPYLASQGEFDWFYTNLWEVGEIPAQGEATLLVDYYLLQDEIFPLYAEVYSMVQPDIDSETHNGDYMTVNEDDEAILIIGELVKNTTIESKKATLYPNPVKGNHLNISLGENYMEYIDIQVINHLGQIVYTYNTEIGTNVQFSTEELSSGFYTVKATRKSGLSEILHFLRIL